MVENLQLAGVLLAMCAVVAGFLWTENKIDKRIEKFATKGR